MRDQYAGDVSDLLKLAFLRALAADDRTIGVGWYYNPADDGRPDGRHRGYCDEPKWESFDVALWNALRKLPERSVSALEKLPIWPLGKTYFHRIPVPSIRDRHSWAMDMKTALQEASIIFLDPDNGVGGVSRRHTTVGEIAAMKQSGRAVVLIKFPKFDETHDRQIEAYHSLLRTQTGALSVMTVRTCVSVEVLNKRGRLQGVPRVRWFTLVDADDVVIERARQFARRFSGIEKCKADVVCWPGKEDADHRIGTGEESITMLPETPREPERFHKAMRSPVPVQSPPLRNVPKPNHYDEAKTALPVCDWVYFATPSPEDFHTTRNLVREFGMIFRTVFNSAGIPIANAKKLHQGNTILLVHGGGRGKNPYRPVFSCTVVVPPCPVPHFDAFSFADDAQEKRLRNSGYPPDPHLKMFTGISIKVSRDLERLTDSIPRPLGNNTIRRWSEVFGGADLALNKGDLG